MGGFTIYETLRIFLPGAIAISILDLTIRITTGTSLTAQGTAGAAPLLNRIESPGTFLALSMAAGLLLYLLDLGERLRIFRGTKDKPIPSSLMESFVASENANVDDDQKLKSFVSVFFLLEDAYLPDTLHERVYFFGAMYKAYTDTRVLLVNSLIFGVPFSIIYSRGQHKSTPAFEFGNDALITIAAIFSIIFVIVLCGQRIQNSRESNERDQLEPVTAIQAKAIVRAWNSLIGHLGAVIQLVRSAWRLMMLQIALGVASVLCATYGRGAIEWAYLIPAALCSVIWFWIEIGPPRLKPRYTKMQEHFLTRCAKIAPTETVRFQVNFRGLTDSSLFLPLLLGATLANANSHRSEYAVGAWALVVLPAVCIMAIHKHESRALDMYAHQAAWIQLMRNKIPEILRNRKGMPLSND